MRKTFKNERNFILVQNNIRKTHKKSPIKENYILVQTKQRKMRKTFKNEQNEKNIQK
jgi:hypothetical protein